MRFQSCLLWVALVCLVSFAPADGSAHEPPRVADVTPPRDDGPVSVAVGIYVVDISHISEVDNAFQTELDIVAFWEDSRLAFDAQAEGSNRRVFVGPASERLRTQIWNAQGTAANAVGRPTMVSQKITTFSDGRLMLEARITATLRANLDYRRFPFDRQVLPIYVESYAWNRDIVRFEALPDQTGFDPSFQMPEWEVIDVKTSISEIARPRDPTPYSRVAFDIAIDRKAGFYIWKIFLPLFVIVAISWVVFWMGREALGRRAGVSVTGILTVIAYQFIVSKSIPRVSYLTVLDKLLLLSIVTIATALVVSIIVEAVQTRDRDPGGIDRACRWVFPLVYFSLVSLIIFKGGVF